MIRLALFDGSDAQLDAMVAIEAASASQPWTRRMFAEEMTNSSASWSLAVADLAAADLAAADLAAADTDLERPADRGPGIVGFVGLRVVVDEGHVLDIAVAPRWRRTRVASHLLLAAFDEAVRRDVVAMTLEVRASNIAAQRLYHRFGFVPSGVRRGYYPSTPDRQAEDGVVMWTEALASAAQVGRIERRRSELLPMRAAQSDAARLRAVQP